MAGTGDLQFRPLTPDIKLSELLEKGDCTIIIENGKIVYTNCPSFRVLNADAALALDDAKIK